ncbi:MAG TPA: HNH endonuclease signature motif containing protein [Polyangiaceae bacterium]|nr:HNH endonuclease signature motif containing protein [Polyangiaceae bacterium]
MAKCRAQLDWEEGRWLLVAMRARAHRHLGFGSFFEYVESLFGYKPRSIEEKLRVAEALETLPKLSAGLRSGELTWSAARELTRVATFETEWAWHEAIRHLNVRQIEALVSGRKPGDHPDSPADASLRKHLLTFEVTAETLATYRDALARLRRDSGGPLDEETALLMMARRVLGGPLDEGRASYQIAFTLCEACGRGSQLGRGESLAVGTDIIEMVACDAQYIGSVRATSARPSVSASARSAPNTGGDSPNHPEHLSANDRNPAHVGARVPLPSVGKRAAQSIPPATRRLVLHRDGGRCVVPGCRHAVYLDVHHLAPRSEGGGHDPDGLIVLCAAHHRALHRGQLMVEGRVATGLVFRHADGSLYRGALSAPAVAAQTRAFGALRRLGFREGEVRRALDRLRRESGGASADSAGVVRAALRVLTEAAGAEVGCTGAAQDRS